MASNKSGGPQYVYTMNRVGKVVPPGREILKDISLSFYPGAKIGVLGLNGAGKSTLLRMLVGTEQPDGGELRVGETVVIAYVDQSREALNGDHSVWQEISGGQDIIVVGKTQIPSRA